MTLHRLHLKDGVAAVDASRQLGMLITQAGNILGHASGRSVDVLRDTYLDWAETTETQLRHMTFDSDVGALLQTRRYWHIRDIDAETPQPFPLVAAEIAVQTDALQRLRDDLDRRIRWAASAPGRIVVLDTNVLLQYMPPEQVDWTEVVGHSEVRLVIPLRVIEELDAKKYGSNKRLAARARGLLPRLLSGLGNGQGPGALRTGVTIEVPVSPGFRNRPSDADGEILETCRELQLLSAEGVVLITADTAMWLRAQAQGTTVLAMPSQYQRESENAAESEA